MELFVNPFELNFGEGIRSFKGVSVHIGPFFQSIIPYSLFFRKRQPLFSKNCNEEHYCQDA